MAKPSLCFCTNLSAQDMQRTVIGSAGDYYENLLFGNIHWTVGEIAVSNFQNDLELGEGFHQVYYDLFIPTNIEEIANVEISIAPNPTTGSIQVTWPETHSLFLSIYSSIGQLLFQKQENIGRLQIDMHAFPAGVYWLNIRDANGYQRNFQVQKINH